jgi:hypothetical protein
LITAYHCLYQFDTVDIDVNELGSPRLKLTDLVTQSFVCSPALDLCVFEVTQDGDKKFAEHGRRPAKLTAGLPQAATRVEAVGNPIVIIAGREKTPFCFVSGATVSQSGKFSQRIGADFADGDAQDTVIVLLESLQITYGFSGGPVIRSASNHTRDDREVVGILQGGDPKNGKISWCIPAEQIIKLIDNANDKWEAYPPTEWKQRLFNAAAFRRSDETLLLGFPLQFGSRDKISEPLGQNMDTQITISENGRLDAKTKTWATRNVGFTGEVIVYLCDASGNVLWRTKDRHTYGLSLFNMDRTETWDEQVPLDVLSRVSKCLIHHQDSPKQLEDALGLATVKFGDTEARILKEVAKAADLKWEISARE